VGTNGTDILCAEIRARSCYHSAPRKCEEPIFLILLQPDADDDAGQEGMISVKGKNDGENKNEVELIKTGKAAL
jgi:hypothetical protein